MFTYVEKKEEMYHRDFLVFVSHVIRMNYGSSTHTNKYPHLIEKNENETKNSSLLLRHALLIRANQNSSILPSSGIVFVNVIKISEERRVACVIWFGVIFT